MSAAEGQLSLDEAQLVAQTAKQAAYAESLAGWCTQKNAKSASLYANTLRGWRERNHWDALVEGAVNSEFATGEYDGLKKEALNEFNAHGFKSVFLCAQIGRVLSQGEHDPSVAHGADLGRIAGEYQHSAASADATAMAPTATPSAVPPAPTATPAPGPTVQPPVAPAATVQNTVPTTSPVAPAAAGGNVTVGDTTMSLGPGWAVTKNTADTAVLQKSTKQGNLLIALKLEPLQGTLEQAFPAEVRRNFPGEPLQLKYINHGMTRGGLQALTVRDGGRLNLPNRPRARLQAVGIATQDGRLFLAMLLMRSDYESLMSKAGDEFGAMMATLRFTSQPQSALWDYMHPAQGSGGQSGLYWSNTLQNTLNPLGGMDLRAIRNYIVLLPNGQAYNDLPESGHVLDMDFAAACQKKPTKCGTYSIQGNTIHLRWLGEYGLVRDEQGAWVGGEKGSFDAGGSYRRITPVHNLHLQGRFTSTFAMVGTMATQSTSVVSETYITLTSDGRYQKSGFSGASFNNSNAAGTVGGRKGVQSGTYSMDGYTLTLTPAGGAPELYSLVLEDPTPNAGALFINDDAFLKKGQ